MSHIARRIALATLCGIALVACSLPTPLAPTPTGVRAPDTSAYPEPGTSPTAAGQAPAPTTEAYPGPGTAVPATATAPAGATPTVAGQAPTATVAPPAGPLVGPEWTIAYQGDLNADGRADVVAYKAGAVAAGSAFQQPAYATYKGSASEVVVVQADSAGQPQIQVVANLTSITSGGVALVDLASRSPRAAALMVSATPGSRPLLAFLEVSSSGGTIRQAIGLVWDAGAQRYVLLGSLVK